MKETLQIRTATYFYLLLFSTSLDADFVVATSVHARPLIAIKRADDSIMGLQNTSVSQSTGASNGPGANTGFYVTPSISNVFVGTALRFATGNDDPSRNPLTVTLEGTNATGTTALNLGSSWTLMYSSPAGIDPTIVPDRSTYAPQQHFSNTIAYGSCRLLVTSQRNLTNSVQYSESQTLGYA